MSQKRAASPSPCGDERPKQYKSEPIVNPSLFHNELKHNFSEAFRNGKDFVSDGVLELHSDPFPCCVIKDFISDKDFVQQLKSEILNFKFFEKSNDLFKFHQSNDLIDEKSHHTKALRGILFDSFREWLQDTMGVSLEPTVDMSCAKYEYTDTLLCHDDELEGRRIAFIYYLVPEDWAEEDGGLLDLFSTDADGHPGSIVRSITPSYNNFLFFEVSEKSYHQVSEVVSKSKTRLSISGWFHGESLSRKTLANIPSITPNFAEEKEDEILLSWVNPMYLNPDIVVDIEEQFEDNSEIQLKDFLQKDKYELLLKELKSSDISWKKGGPPNQRLCWFPEDGHVTKLDTVASFLSLIKSTPFFKLVKKFTGLDMANLDPDESDCEDAETEDYDIPPSCIAEVRRWKNGCYTLLHDQDHCGGEFVLDALLHINCEDFDEAVDGGYISYIANDGGEELMRVQPTANCLSLVYRDEETTRFVKYLNCKTNESGCAEYYDISAVYFEGTRNK